MKDCGYFMHTAWSKGGDATCLKELWWSWLVDEPAYPSGEVVPSLNTIGQRAEVSQCSTGSSLHPSTSKGIASSSKRKQDLVLKDADVDSSPMKRRCALEGPSHFPPTKSPTHDAEKNKDASTVENITDLTQRLSMSQP